MAFARTLLQNMLRNSPDYDVQLHVEDGDVHTFGAHRVVLATASDVFADMFAGKRDGVDDIVRISDFCPEAVKEALGVIYGGELSACVEDWSLAGQVWDFGVRFHIDHVVQLARTAALQLLSTANCLRLLAFALHVHDGEAVQMLLAFIADKDNFLHVVTSEEFEGIQYSVLAELRRPGAGECVDEVILSFEKVWFDALMAWVRACGPPRALSVGEDDRSSEMSGSGASAQSAQLAALEKALRLVDFTRMKTHELREVAKSETAAASVNFAPMLVRVLLVRSEALEGEIVEKNKELDDIGGAYQVALFQKNEADRNARQAHEHLRRVTGEKQMLERRLTAEPRRRHGSNSSSHSHRQGRRKPQASPLL